jgi:polyketide-type polyunsaturated fatty acid synthase PfaA
MTRTPIAIVGLAGTFAGSRNLGEYWDNILREVDSIGDVPATHFAIDDYYDPDPKAQDKTYCRRGGFIPGADFNPLEFGLPPNILELTDVAQLLSLIIAREALADAGYGAANPHAERTGVVLGVSALGQITPLVARLQYPIWKRVLLNSGISEADSDAIVDTIKKAYIDWREDAFPGYLSNVVAGRIANRLDLRGINCSIDAACASSIASLQMAARELAAGSCDVMLAGGVDLNNSVSGFLSFSKTPAFTAHEHMRPFDAASDGMLVGEGIGMLVLRRLDDAERDGDRIYAVIRGIGASSDGRFKSIYAPRMEGQELALRRAYDEAGIEPSSIGLVEAHGTGTPTGDPTELAALQRVFGDASGRSRRIALGSVKSQIGHTKVASGAASLIKTALALHDKILPPTINVDVPHAALEQDGSPFYLNTHARPWFSLEPRRAAVSSFGFGGTNFHVVLEEHSRRKPEGPRTQPSPFAIFLQAQDPAALRSVCGIWSNPRSAAPSRLNPRASASWRRRRPRPRHCSSSR